MNVVPPAEPLAVAQAETQKLDPFPPDVHQTGLGFIQGQPTVFQPPLEPIQERRSLPGPAHDHKVVCVAHHHWLALTALVDFMVQPVQEQVRQQWGYDSSLRRSPLITSAARWSARWVLFLDGRLQPGPDQLQHRPIADPSGHQPQQGRVWDAVEVSAQVGINHLAALAPEYLGNHLDGLMRIPPRPIRIAVLMHIRLEDGQ